MLIWYAFIDRTLKGKMFNTVNGHSCSLKGVTLLLFNNKAADPIFQVQQSNQGARREGKKNRLVSLELKLLVESLLHFQNRHNYKSFAFNSKIQNFNITFTMSILLIFQCFVCFTAAFPGFWGIWPITL